jgi:hypothetical protein
MRDGLALNNRPDHVLANNSRIADMYGIVSASNRFSMPFSSSIAFSRLASGTVMPPNLVFQV